MGSRRRWRRPSAADGLACRHRALPSADRLALCHWDRPTCSGSVPHRFFLSSSPGCPLRDVRRPVHARASTLRHSAGYSTRTFSHQQPFWVQCELVSCASPPPWGTKHPPRLWILHPLFIEPTNISDLASFTIQLLYCRITVCSLWFAGASCYGPLQPLLREVSDKALPDTERLVASNNGIGNGPRCNSSSAPMAEASSGESDSEFGDADDEEEVLVEDDYDGEDVTDQVSIPSAIPEQNVVPTPLGDCGCVPSSPGYRKRTRLPKGVIPPHCRQPRKKMEPTEGGGGRKKPKGAVTPPAMASIGDDVLGDIFLRLPNTATLARAALACKRWRRVASDPALLRRFHSVHGPPPLLGFIMSGPPPRAFAVEGPDRRFLPAPSRNPHLNAAAAAADIHFEDFATKNPRSGSVIDEWLFRSYDGSRLLSYGFIEYEQLAVYDPIGRTTDLVCRPDIMQFDFEFVAVHYALLVDEADASFQVVGAQFWNGLIRAAVFSSRTGEWAPLPSLHAPEPWRMRGGMRAGRFAYWQSNTRLERCFYSDELERSLVLDTTTMEWTLIQVPFPAKESYCVADMAEHGGLCLVSSKDQFVQLWVRDNNGGWVIKKQVSLLKQFWLLKKLRHDEWMKRVRILAVRDGYVYMEFWSIRKPNSYLLVLNWETMKLSVFANDTTNKYRGPAFPFFMTWAPPLLSPAEQQRLCLQGYD